MKIELSSKELSILAAALNIDLISDEVPGAEKVALLDRLNSIIESIN